MKCVNPVAYRAALHFLAVARTERRRFPITLDLDGMAQIHALPTDNRDFIAGLLASLAFAGTDMGLAPDLERLEKLWPRVLRLRDMGGIPYVILGDSHSTFYRHAALRDGSWLVPLNICCSAGSAIGLGKPNSRSGYGIQLRDIARFLDAAEDQLKLPVPILVQFGQVDLEFVQPFRRVKTGSTEFDADDFKTFVAGSIQSYIGLLKEVFPEDRRSIVTVLGVFPPALADETLRGGYVNGHIASLEAMDEATLRTALAQLQWPDLRIRTELHADYNARLHNESTAAGFNFASDFSALLAPDGVLHRAVQRCLFGFIESDLQQVDAKRTH